MYAVDIATDGEAALYQMSINDYDLVILDVMLPRKDGYEVCCEMRAAGSAVPVLMLTARDAALPTAGDGLAPGGIRGQLAMSGTGSGNNP